MNLSKPNTNHEPRTHLVADLHTHTVASGHAYSTTSEIAKSAKEKSLEVVAITDHGPAMPGGAHLYHFFNLRVIPKEIDGVRILKGAEANIVGPNGEIDIDNDLIQALDVVLLAFHVKCGYKGYSEKDNTTTLIRAMEEHNVKVLAHLGNPIFPLDYDMVTKKAKELDVAIEINNSSYLPTTSRRDSYELDLRLAGFAKKNENIISLGSDAHIDSDIGRLDKALELAEKVGIEKDKILNYSKEKVLNFLGK